MALTPEQYWTLTELSDTVKDPILKKDLQRLTEEHKPRPDFKAQFEALPDGSVVEFINDLGSTQIAVRDKENQDNAPTLYYAGDREHMRGKVITGSSLHDLNWEDFEEMHVLTRESGKPKAKNSLDDFEQFECGGQEWLVLEDRADYDWWANNVRMAAYFDVISLRPHDVSCDPYTYVWEDVMDSGELEYTYPLYARKDGDTATVNYSFLSEFNLDHRH